MKNLPFASRAEFIDIQATHLLLFVVCLELWGTSATPQQRISVRRTLEGMVVDFRRDPSPGSAEMAAALTQCIVQWFQ